MLDQASKLRELANGVKNFLDAHHCDNAAVDAVAEELPDVAAYHSLLISRLSRISCIHEAAAWATGEQDEQFANQALIAAAPEMLAAALKPKRPKKRK